MIQTPKEAQKVKEASQVHRARAILDSYETTGDVQIDKSKALIAFKNANKILASALPTWYDVYFTNLTGDNKSLSELGSAGTDKFEMTMGIVIGSINIMHQLSMDDADIIDDPKFVELFYDVLWTALRNYALYSCNTIHAVDYIMDYCSLLLRENYVKVTCTPSCKYNICNIAYSEPQYTGQYDCGRAMSCDTVSAGKVPRIYIHSVEKGTFFPLSFNNNEEYDSKYVVNSCSIQNSSAASVPTVAAPIIPQAESASAAQTGGNYHKQKHKIYKLKYLKHT